MAQTTMVKPINFDGVFAAVSRAANGAPNGGQVQFTSAEALKLLALFLVYKEELLTNMIGAYNISDNVVGGKARWASFDSLNWITTTRPSNCSRTALTDHEMTEVSKTLCKNHVFLKLCKDSIVAQLDAAWSSIWGAGNDLNEIRATEGGEAIFQQFVNRTIAAIGNDYTSIAWFGNHPIIASTVAANPLSLSQAVLDRVEDTLQSCDGFLKQVDALKDGSHAWLNNTFAGGEMDGDKFIGDALQWIDDLETLADPEFSVAMDGLKELHEHPIVFVTSGIFNKLVEQITGAYPGLASSLCYNMDGMVAEELGIELKNKVTHNAFVWKGKLIVKRSDWDHIARTVGFYHHRILMTVPQNLGLALDVPAMDQLAGMGLSITKSPTPTDGGAYFLETNYQMATAILRDKYMVNASYTAVRS